MKRILASVVLIAGFSSGNALACLCNPGEMDQPMQRADVAFVGQPAKIEAIPLGDESKTVWQSIRASLSDLLGEPAPRSPPPFPEFLDAVRVTFEVSEYLKGSGPRRISIMTGYGETDCGLPVSVSTKYTIYARLIDGTLRTSYCFGSTEFVRRRSAPRCAAST